MGNLLNARYKHTSWSTDAGIYLLGGDPSSTVSRTTELITGDTTQAGFGLKYDTRLACGIPNGDNYIMTGGVGTPTTVSRYSQTGWIEDLPSLNTGRYNHGCSTYLDSNNQQIYLVTGGSSGSIYLSSTEQLVKGGGSWTIKENSLPARLYSLRSITLNNQIFTTGGYDSDSSIVSDKILLLDEETTTFKEIGKLEQRRYSHSVSVVNINDFTCS